ncbi:MAG TPA: hypothetical protein VIT91_11985 [Chthoniobacterales bacterium]
MLTCDIDRNETANRANARSAIRLDNRPINISIRANPGEGTLQNGDHSVIDKFSRSVHYFAIEWPVKSMFEEDAISAIEAHRKKCPESLSWFAGVRSARRIHPHDEHEVHFLTNAWIDVSVDTPDGAQRVARRLLQLGCVQSPIHTDSPSARHVFAYALNEES